MGYSFWFILNSLLFFSASRPKVFESVLISIVSWALLATEAAWDLSPFFNNFLPMWGGDYCIFLYMLCSFSISEIKSSNSSSCVLWSYITFASYLSSFPGEFERETSKSPELSKSSLRGDYLLSYFTRLNKSLFWQISQRILSSSRF